jgi:hypothetical protein
MTKTDCYDSFQRGQLERQNHPLPYGKYKLVELLRNLRACQKEVITIGDVVSGRAAANALRCCTIDDKAWWLKSLPLNVAYWLGRDLLPGFEALVGDGLSAQRISSAYPAIRQSTMECVNRLELLRSDVLPIVKNEYAAARRGMSIVAPVLGEAAYIAEQALSVVDTSIDQ